MGRIYHEREIPFHPIAEEYPRMSDAEIADLGEAIKRRGLDYLITRFRGAILDGRNRFIACCRAGVALADGDFIDLPEDLTEEQLRDYVEDKNDRRRHETPKSRKARRVARDARIVAMRREGASVRTIAGEVNADPKQVRRAIAKTGGDMSPPAGPEQNGLPSPPRVTGKDGKSYPASRPAPPPEPRDEEESAPVAALDAIGLPVPERLRAAFASRPAFDEVIKLIRQAEKALSALAKSPGGEEVRRRCQLIEEGGRQRFRLQRLHDAVADLKLSRPHAPCPYCHRETPGRANPNCSACRGSGWLAKVEYEAAPAVYRVACEKAREGVVS